MQLQHLKVGDYNGIGEVLEAIRAELMRLQPIDSATVKHSISGNGTVSHVFISETPSRRIDESDEIAGGSAVQIPAPFRLKDSSTYNEDGTVKQLQVTVWDGTDSGYAGYVNGVLYRATTLPLTVGITEYWIYAVDGQIYALNHEFHSDFFPVLYCGKVSVVDGKIEITQLQFSSDYQYAGGIHINVPVCGAEYGAVTLAGTLSCANHVLTADYTVAVKGLLNNNALNFPSTAIPVAENGTLLAYVKLLTVGNDVTPESGFEFSATGQPSQTVEWHQVMFRYTLTANTFKVLFRQHPLHMFTFTRIYLNASESGE